MMFGWPDKPTKVEPKYVHGGDNPARIFEIGKYQVTVPDDPEATVTYHVPHYRHGQSDPRTTFPNMEVSDGEVRFPVEDLVPVILSRLDPVDLARALWQNEDVKAEFMSCLTERWSEGGIGDADRRKFLASIKEAIHSKALDAFAYTAQKLERAFGQKWFFYHEIHRVNDGLREAGFEDRDGNPIRLRHEDSDPAFRIGGEHWNDAREHWRAEAARMFAIPADETEQVSA